MPWIPGPDNSLTWATNSTPPQYPAIFPNGLIFSGSAVPLSHSASGQAGTIVWGPPSSNSASLYICVSSSYWMRTTLTTWTP